MPTHGVHCLLTGGQACVFYGAAEFSRDTDLPLLASPDHVSFWLNELRTPALLIELAAAKPAAAAALVGARPLIAEAVRGDPTALEVGLGQEEAAEREADRRYWLPVRAELQRLRRQRV